MKRRQLEYIKTDYRVSVCPDILGGCTRQLHLPDGTYYSDRNLAPLVLMPEMTLVDPNTGEQRDNAASMLTGGAWYRLDSSTASTGISAASQITDGQTGTGSDGAQITLYEIDSTPGSATYGKLTVRENVDADNPVTLVFQARLPNGRLIGMQVVLETEAVSSGIPKIAFDNNPRGLYNPVEDERYFTVSPMLLPDNGYTPTWSWESCHDGRWGALGSTRLDWAVEALAGGGVKIDRKFMPQTVTLRVHADITVEGVPVRLTGEVSHTRRVPHLEFEAVGIGDMPEGTTTISPRMAITAGGRPVEGAEALEELDIVWTDDNGSRVADSVMNPSIAVSALGASRTLGYDVRDRGGYFPLTDSEGAFLTDSEGALILSR